MLLNFSGPLDDSHAKPAYNKQRLWQRGKFPTAWPPMIELEV